VQVAVRRTSDRTGVRSNPTKEAENVVVVFAPKSRLGLASKLMTRREAMKWGAIALLETVACRKKSKTPLVSQRPPSARAKRGSAWSETGIASWYGIPYHGRRAANGEIYDMNQLTAAHRTLPFGSMVRVTSETNGKSVTVRITDRGPFIDGRIIDLSREAARRIDMIGPGIMQVRLEVDGPAETRAGTPLLNSPAIDQGSFAVQVGLFNDKTRAEKLKANLTKRYGRVDLVAREGERIQWRVLVGNVATPTEAEALTSVLRQKTGEAEVVRRDLP
jgi:rare lipoprotein A